MKLDTKYKADVRFFIYYLLNGTLDFDLLNNKLQKDRIEYFETHPELFFQCCCVFINHLKHRPDSTKINRRVAEYICKTIEPENFTQFDNFESWEIDFVYSGNDFFNSFKEFAHKVAFDEIEKLYSTGPYYKFIFSNGATFSETLFVIWANNIEINYNIVINQKYAIDRAATWFSDPEVFEDWEVELEM